MPASSIGAASSVRSKTPSTPAKLAPHMLGGSKNLMSERFRREQAEQTLLQTRQSLKAVATELAPQVDELTKAVKMMQMEKHHQLNLDEASQQVLESLQDQINNVEARETQFSATLDERMERLLEQMREDFRAEKYALQVFVAQVQDSQDTLVAEVRLLQHELTATKQFLSQQVETMDDALTSLRSELARARDQQALTNQAIHTRAVEMDEKLFTLDKETLKLKLALPSSVSAQMPLRYTDCIQSSETAMALLAIDANRGSVGVGQKLAEVASGLEAMKAELASYRNADRQQFDAIANRLRESSKSQQSLKRELDVRFQEIQIACDKMVTKVPSELSRRFLKAQSQWEDQLQSLRARVDELGTSSRLPVVGATSGAAEVELYDATALRSMDAAIRHLIERLDDLHSSVSSLKTDVDVAIQGHDTVVEALHSAVRRLEADVLGLYDWTRQRVSSIQEDVVFTSNVLQYFQQHAKILPKA